MKIRAAAAATLLLIPVIWFALGHRTARDTAPDFRDAPRDMPAMEGLGSEAGAVPVPDLPAPQASDAGGDKVQADRFFKYLGDMYKTPEPSPIQTGNFKSLSPVSGIGQILYTLKIEKMLNAFLYSDLIFKTSGGATVHLSGNKSSNCPGGSAKCDDNEKVFIILTTDGGESSFIRVMDVVNYGIFMSGSKTVTIDGQQFTVKVHADASSPEKSMIEVKSGDKKVIESTLLNMSSMAARKGVEVRLGRAYRLLYSSELAAVGKKDAKFTAKKQVVLMPYPVDANANYYLLYTSEITPDGVVYPELDRNFGFKLENGALDIFRVK